MVGSGATGISATVEAARAGSRVVLLETSAAVRKDGFVFAFPGRGVALANMTHVPTPTDPQAA
ncbi:MAG: FAD-binding protein [Alphaproteobacteria bacterium]